MKRILIIEDNLEIAELERDFLEASAIESVIETDGTKGLERALQEDFDLILLDIMLPGTDGFHICRRIREEKEVPILMVSANTKRFLLLSGKLVSLTTCALEIAVSRSSISSVI